MGGEVNEKGDRERERRRESVCVVSCSAPAVILVVDTHTQTQADADELLPHSPPPTNPPTSVSCAAGRWERSQVSGSCSLSTHFHVVVDVDVAVVVFSIKDDSRNSTLLFVAVLQNATQLIRRPLQRHGRQPFHK